VHYAPDFFHGFQVGGTGTFESGLPLNPTISINSGALNGTNAVSTASVNGSGASNRAPFDTRNGFRQTARKTIDMRVSKRFNKGLLFNANYTLSKSEDTGQNSTTFIANSATMVDPFNNEAERGPASFDRRHRGVVAVHYAPDYLHGFQIGGTGTFESGLPLNPTISINSGALTASGAFSPASVNGSGASNRAPFDTRNGFRQTSRKTIDMRVSKRFNVGGRRQIEALWEAFNVFNTVNYTTFGTTKYNAVSSSFDAGTNKAVVNLTSNAGFGVATTASNTLFGPRDMQIGFKYLW
jgi:hypothetical protein